MPRRTVTNQLLSNIDAVKVCFSDGVLLIKAARHELDGLSQQQFLQVFADNNIQRLLRLGHLNVLKRAGHFSARSINNERLAVDHLKHFAGKNTLRRCRRG